MLNKVYCINCKFHKDISISYGYIPSPDRCMHLSQLVKCNSAVKECYRLSHCCASLNKNNDCKNYVRKWYKFWVKHVQS